MEHTFPHSFKAAAHGVVPGATQWLLHSSTHKRVVSVVGGGRGLYGDGVNTFEMWDFREEEPQQYLTREEINQHLKNHPVP